MRTSPLALLVWILLTSSACAESKNGFDLSNSEIDTDKILHGGPPKDGIPAIDEPEFTPAELADTNVSIVPEARVLGVAIEGYAKAYPIKILDRHEVVNDRIGNAGYSSHLLSAVRDGYGVLGLCRSCGNDVRRVRSALQQRCFALRPGQ